MPQFRCKRKEVGNSKALPFMEGKRLTVAHLSNRLDLSLGPWLTPSLPVNGRESMKPHTFASLRTRYTRTAVIAALAIAAFPAGAQDSSVIPEEPAWSTMEDDLMSGPDELTDVAPLEPDMDLRLDVGETFVPPPPGVESTPPPPAAAPTMATDSGIRQPVLRMPVDPTSEVRPPLNTDYYLASEADASVGLPDEDNYYLPSFENWNWFQMEGLKFRIGPIHARITLRTSLEYNTNIFATSRDPTADFVGRIGPTITLGTGGWRGEATNFALLTYTPSFVYYFQNRERDNVNENFTFLTDYTFSRYQTNLSVRYQRSNEPNATQQGLNEYSTLGVNWNNSYAMGTKTFARMNFGYLFQDYSNRDDYTTVSVAPQLAYELSPKATVFAGPFLGIAYIGDGSTQPFQGINAGVTYSNLSKLSGQFVAGLQARQYEGENLSGAKDFVTPILEFELNYQVRELTSLSFGLTRDVQISDLQRGLTYINNELRLGLRQKLFGRVDFGLNLTYQFLEYEGDGPDGRNDQYLSVTPRLSYTFWRDQVTWSIFYRRQQLVSDVSIRDYEVNAFGSALEFRF